jgi:hypothetical protein
MGYPAGFSPRILLRKYNDVLRHCRAQNRTAQRLRSMKSKRAGFRIRNILWWAATILAMMGTALYFASKSYPTN